MKIKPNIRSFYTLTTPIKWEAVNVVKEYTKSINYYKMFWMNSDNMYDTKAGKVRTVKYIYADGINGYYRFDLDNIKDINELFKEKFKNTKWKVEISTLHNIISSSTKIKIMRKNEDIT